MDNINFERKKTKRKFAGYYFNRLPVFAGDLVEYREGKNMEIREVQIRAGRYYVGDMELSFLKGIKRVISMGKKE
jgi:hypothetical protein